MLKFCSKPQDKKARVHSGREAAWVTVTPHKPPFPPALVISQQDAGEAG